MVLYTYICIQRLATFKSVHFDCKQSFDIQLVACATLIKTSDCRGSALVNAHWDSTQLKATAVLLAMKADARAAAQQALQLSEPCH